MRAKIYYMSWHTIDLNSLVADYCINLPFAEFSGTASIWEFDPNKVSYLICSSSNFWNWFYFVYSFYVLLILIDPIGWSAWWCYIISGSNVVPIHGLNEALCPGCYYDGVTPLRYPIILWSVCTSVFYSPSPFGHEVLKDSVLSINILTEEPQSQKTDFSCITETASWHDSWCHTVKCIRLQSISIWKWLSL